MKVRSRWKSISILAPSTNEPIIDNNDDDHDHNDDYDNDNDHDIDNSNESFV